MPFVRVSFGPVCWSIARYLEAYARSFGLERSGAPKGFHPQVRWEDEGKTSWATVFSCMKTHIQPPMWANVETNWAEVRLDPMSLAFIAQVDIFLYFLFFPYFFPLFIYFSIYGLWKVWKGETTLGGARTSTCIQVRWTSSQNVTFVGQNAPLIHLRRFCFAGWWNRIILYFLFFFNKTHSKVVWIISNRPRRGFS